MKNLKKMTGIILCAAMMLSMLVVGIVSVSAGADTTGPQTPYALRFATNGDEPNFWYNFATDLPTLKLGDVYRFSYYYSVPEGSSFPDNHGAGGSAYFSFKISGRSGDTDNDWLKLDSFQSTYTTDGQWKYEEYTWTVPADYASSDNNPVQIQRFRISLSKTFGSDYLKLTDIRLVKVTDDIAGENLLRGICDNGTFINSDGSVGGYTNVTKWGFPTTGASEWKDENAGWSFSIEAINKDEFKRPTTVTTHTVKDSEGNVLATVNDGEALDLSTLTKPTKDGYRFTGYFTDEECKTPFVSGTVITGDIVLYYGWAERTAGGPEGDYALKITNGGNTDTVSLWYGYSSPTLHEGDHLRFSFYYKSENEDTTFPDFSDRKTPFYFDWNMKTEDNRDHFMGADLFDVTTVDKVWYRLQYDVTIPKTYNGMNLGMFRINFQYCTEMDETIYLAGFRLCYVIDGEEQNNLLHYINEDGKFEYPGGGRAWFISDGNGGYLNPDDEKTMFTPQDESWSFSVVPLDYESFLRPDRTYNLVLNNAKTADGKTAYKFGESVTVKADAAPEGQMFDYWSVSGITAAKLGIAAGDAEITFDMPDRNITLTANYTDADDNGDDNSGDNNNDSSGGNSDPGNTENPKTGDTFPMALWCSIFCTAVLVAVLTLRKKVAVK